jgi:protein-S-isoprenylcysteine O-methyltransferase Ste14
MKTKRYPYIYDLIASILAFSILILSNILSRGENTYLKYTGVFFLLVAAVLWVFPFIHLKKYGKVEEGHSYYETNHIVDKGIYGIVRHPQYLAYMLLVLGFTLISQNWIIVFLAIIAIALYYYHTLKEEKFLTNRFNNEYLDYCKKVPRFNVMKGIINRIRSS